MPITDEVNFVPKILLVEDTRIAQLAAEMVLKRQSCHLTIVASGEEAIVCANEHAFDIILMDIGLGGMTGFDATLEIRQNCPKNQNALIFALTANGEPEFHQKAMQVNMAGFFEKPLTDAHLEVAFNALRHKRSQSKLNGE